MQLHAKLRNSLPIRPDRRIRTTQLPLALLALLAFVSYVTGIPPIVRLSILLALLMRTVWEITRLLHRQRPRRRMRTTALMNGTLSLVFACMAAAIASDADAEWPAFAALALLLLATCIGSFIRYRRLAAEASLRLEHLRHIRRKNKNWTRIG